MTSDENEKAGALSREAAPGYTVGYGRPPKAFRFRKGTSGNPTGARAHKTITLQGALDDALNDKVAVRANGKERRMSTLEATIWKQMQAGLAGNLQAIRYVLKLAKKTSRFASSERVGGVVIVDGSNTRDGKDLAEYRALKAAGKDPWDYVDPTLSEGSDSHE